MTSHIEGYLEDDMGFDKGLTNLDEELIFSLLSLVSVDVALLQGESIIDSNTTMRKWASTEKGWTTPVGHFFWEVVPSDFIAHVRRWYQDTIARDDRYGLFEFDPDREIGRTYCSRLYFLKSRNRSFMIVQRAEDQHVSVQLKQLDRHIRMYEDFLTNANLGLMIMVDEEGSQGVIRFVSKEGQKILQRNIFDLEGIEITDLVRTQHRRLFRDLYQEVKQGRNMTFKDALEIAGKDGDRIEIEAWMGPTIYKGRTAVYLFFSDDTARNLVLEELLMFVTAFNNIDDIVVIADKDLLITHINPTGLIRTGSKLSDILGQPVTILLDPEVEDLNAEVIQEVLRENGIWTGESWVTVCNDDGFPVSVSINVDNDTFGDPDLFVISMKDISDLKQNEQDLKSERDKALFFTELLSHDLLGYLMALRGELELVQAQMGREVLGHHLESPLTLTDHMARLVAQVGVLCQSQAPETLRPIDPLGSIERVVEDVLIRNKNVSIQIETALQDDAIQVLADNLLDNLFMNIIENALKFCDKERPEVKIAINRLQVTGEDMLKISIGDNGPGIPDEDKSAVFYKFFRRFDNQDSRGLGLHLVKTLVNRYNGTVWIEDRVIGRPSEGANIIVQMPITSHTDSSCPIEEGRMEPTKSPDHQLGADLE